MRVSVFGSARPQVGDALYQQAYQLGNLLAMRGHVVLTGGYGGTMEAASRGASEGGGHVIGVTSEEIEHWRSSSPNQWVREEKRFTSLHERLYYLITNCDAAIALPGGVGTLGEIAVLWNHLIIEATQAKGLILVGEGWRKVINTIFVEQGQYIQTREQNLLTFAEDIHQAVQLLPVE